MEYKGGGGLLTAHVEGRGGGVIRTLQSLMGMKKQNHPILKMFQESCELKSGYGFEERFRFQKL